jgi:general stress protein CsbA
MQIVAIVLIAIGLAVAYFYNEYISVIGVILAMAGTFVITKGHYLKYMREPVQ